MEVKRSKENGGKKEGMKGGKERKNNGKAKLLVLGCIIVAIGIALVLASVAKQG